MQTKDIIIFIIIIVLIGGAAFLVFNNKTESEFYTLEESKTIASNWIKENSPTYRYDGSKLNFKESYELDLVDCEDCYQFLFSFQSNHGGYGDRTGKMVTQVITDHEILVTTEHGEVTKAVTDSKFNEIEGELISSSEIKLTDVEEYLKNNIRDLADREEVLGGQFMVYKILFLNDQVALVEYEDGHKAYVARVDFEMNQGVTVDKFTTLESDKFTVEKISQVDFKETGNLTKPEGEWTLVYEKPGQPALTKNLEITEDSICINEVGDLKNSEVCNVGNWEAGDRVKVFGKEVREEEIKVWFLKFN